MFSNISKYAYSINCLFPEFYFVDNQTKNIFLKKFGEKLRELRLSKGYTQERLANELAIEISQISRIERGVINTSVSTLFSLSNILDTPVSDFFLFND